MEECQKIDALDKLHDDVGDRLGSTAEHLDNVDGAAGGRGREHLDVGPQAGSSAGSQASNEQLYRDWLAASVVVSMPHGAEATAPDVGIEDVITEASAGFKVLRHN